jgi:hypothetical protein
MATATSWTDVYAIFKAYPNVVRVNQDEGCFDKDDIKIEVDQDNVDAARTELDKTKYQTQRKAEYPDWGDQLDYIYHNGIEKWKTDIVDPVKTKYPKP